MNEVKNMASRDKRLIETWDVLKFTFGKQTMKMVMINRNMGCIEIQKVLEVAQREID